MVTTHGRTSRRYVLPHLELYTEIQFQVESWSVYKLSKLLDVLGMMAYALNPSTWEAE